MRKRQAHDLEDAHQDLCEYEEVVECRQCGMDLPVLTGLISCLKLIDLDIFSGLGGAKVTAAEGPGGLARDTSRRTRACHCKGNEGC